VVKKHTPILNANLEKAKLLGSETYIENEILLLDKLNAASIPHEARRMDMIVMALCLKGSASYSIDTQEQKVEANDLLIISEQHVIDRFEGTPDLDGLVIIISKAFYNDFMQNVSNVASMFLFSRDHPVISLTEKEVGLFVEYFNLLKEKISDDENRFRHNLVRVLMLAMFYDLSNVISRIQQDDDRRQTRADIIFTQFINLVENNYKKERRVGWYAEQMCITAKYLSETVKQVSHRTPNEWIDNYVTLEIRILLKNSTKNIKQISEEMNFPNQSFLGKFFKEHVGVSPSQYRRNPF
jgi:AraC-type DNA-binding domain-containing proteins